MHEVLTTESPQRRVRITWPFYISAYETTIGQFKQFCDETGYVAFSMRAGRKDIWAIGKDGRYSVGPEHSWLATGLPDNPQLAVGSLTYVDMETFCCWLTARDGIVYRLPTEAEWEFACRAGSQDLLPFPAESLAKFANAPDQSLHRIYSPTGGLNWHPWDDQFPSASPVGSFAPNAFGLFDTIGNQWEVCRDWYSIDPQDQPARAGDDPTGPARGDRRVQRGGSHDPFTVPEAMTCTCRVPTAADNAQLTSGFRVVRELTTEQIAKLGTQHSSRLLRSAQDAVDAASEILLLGEFNTVRAVQLWKAAAVHIQRTKQVSFGNEASVELARLERLVEQGKTLSEGIHSIETNLLGSLTENGWE